MKVLLPRLYGGIFKDNKSLVESKIFHQAFACPGNGWCEMKTYTVEEGLELAHGGKIREAALYFCQAVKEEPYNPELYQRLGELLVALEEWGYAQACFGELIALSPGCVAAYNCMGIIVKRKEYLAEAEAC